MSPTVYETPGPGLYGNNTADDVMSTDALPNDAFSNRDNVELLGDKSPGVARIEQVASQMSRANKICLFLGVLLIAYAYGLDIDTRYSYASYATASYNSSGLLSTINVLRAVIAAAAQPTFAKIADVFGRTEMLMLSIVFYVVGTIIDAASDSLSAYCAGAVLYQIGYTAVTLLVEVVVADISSLKYRLFVSYISATPYLVNAWISGNVTSGVLAVTSWRWGIGMWAIIYPVCALPLILSLFWASRKANKAGVLTDYKTPFQRLGFAKLLVALFWQLDIIGVILMICVFGLILVPFTLAGGVSTTWKEAKIIAPLVVGIVLVPVFIFWERTTKHALVPFHLFKDRGVWAALCIGLFIDIVWYCQGDYLYTLLVVGYGESITSATRISSLYSFVSVLTGTLLGLVVVRVQRLKAFIIFGTVMWMVAFGILIKYRGGSDNRGGIIAGQVLLGFGGGFFTYPVQTLLQSCTRHEHLAVITGLYLSMYNIGSAVGATISGAIWTQVMPVQLAQRISNATLVEEAYGDPFVFILSYPIGTPERTAVIEAYKHTQKILCITGICLVIPLIVFALLLRDNKLGNEQSLPNAEGGVSDSEGASTLGEKNAGSKGFMSGIMRR